MALLSWITGVGLPSLLGGSLLVAAAIVWFRTPGVGHHLGLALAIIGVSSIAYARGYSDRARDDRSASLSAQVTALEKMLRDGAALQEKHALDALRTREELEEHRRVADELREQFRAAPSPVACQLTPGERRRVLAIPIGSSRPRAVDGAGQLRSRALPRSRTPRQSEGSRPRLPAGPL